MADGNAPNRVFLRKILYRIDFQLISQQVYEDLFNFIATEFGAYFSNQGVETTNNIDVEIHPDRIEDSHVNKRPQTVFVFTKEPTDTDDSRELKIGRTFLFLELKLNLHDNHIPYYNWIASIMRKMREYPMMRLTRIALRKYNEFYLLDQYSDELDRIFAIKYISEPVIQDYTLDASNNIQLFHYDKYILRFTRNYYPGLLNNPEEQIENAPAHKISFDLDFFSTDSDILNAFIENAQTELIKMNALIYRFFESIIQHNVLEKMNNGDLLKEYHVDITI